MLIVKESKNYKIALYFRSASHDSDVLKKQKEVLIDFCQKSGLKITEIYIDDGFSGLNINRPALQRMLKDIEDKKIDFVIVESTCRLTRSLKDFNTFCKMFRENDVRFLALNENFDTLKIRGKGKKLTEAQKQEIMNKVSELVEGRLVVSRHIKDELRKIGFSEVKKDNKSEETIHTGQIKFDFQGFDIAIGTSSRVGGKKLIMGIIFDLV